jgi:hypothetical protein
MGRHVYDIVKAPIGWSLFRDRERLGSHVCAEDALAAAAKAGAADVREGFAIQINVSEPELNEIDAEVTWPPRWTGLLMKKPRL